MRKKAQVWVFLAFLVYCRQGNKIISLLVSPINNVEDMEGTKTIKEIKTQLRDELQPNVCA